MNPGLEEVFPWLANVAANYSKYMLHTAKLRYVSSVPNAQTTFQSVGSITMLYDPNPAGITPDDPQQIGNFLVQATTKPSENLQLSLPVGDRSMSSHGLSVRMGAVPSNASIHDYDSGVAYVATAAQPTDGTLMGKLYLDYVATLMEPISRGSAPTCGAAVFTLAGTAVNLPLGTSATSLSDQIGVSLDVAQQEIHFPTGCAGNWLISLRYTGGTGVTLAAPTLTLTDAVAGPKIFTAGTATTLMTPDAGTASIKNVIYQETIKIQDNLATPVVVLSGGTVPTGSGELHIEQLPFSLMK